MNRSSQKRTKLSIPPSITIMAVCKSDLDGLGIKYRRVSNWTVNTRAKCRLGQCRKIAGNLFDISIFSMLLADEVDDRVTLNTIMHELLHTVPGGINHKGKWKIYAEFVNKRLPNYNIKRVAKESKTGIVVERKAPIYRYILRCTKCGQEIKRQKETKVVTNYKRYRCGKCGGRLEKIL